MILAGLDLTATTMSLSRLLDGNHLSISCYRKS
jgi:hypothetical protein